MRENKVVFYSGILLLLFPLLSFSQPNGSSSLLEIDTENKKTIKIESERAIMLNLGRSQINRLETGNQLSFSDQNIFGVGFQEYFSNRYSVNVNMNFAFNEDGEQSYYSGMLLGTFHRPVFNDRTILRAAGGLSFSEYQFSGALASSSIKASWLELVGSIGIEFKIRKDLAILSTLDTRQAGLSSINDQRVKGRSFTFQPVGLIFYY